MLVTKGEVTRHTYCQALSNILGRTALALTYTSVAGPILYGGALNRKFAKS
jgi:hypothetical protein